MEEKSDNGEQVDEVRAVIVAHDEPLLDLVVPDAVVAECFRSKDVKVWLTTRPVVTGWA